ncbi:hypothetical protein [Paraburkholderia fungorum]|uniref:hypothetical protein n=1 Tax=Paraburkholderia fungorum TaxID=134537 RepID=UPI0038B9B3AF
MHASPTSGPAAALDQHICQDTRRRTESIVGKTHNANFALITAQTIAYTLGTSFSEAQRMRQEWIDYLQRIDWNAPVTLALTSAAVGSVITLTWISARDARERKRQRRDTALELALSLESYARTCRTMMHKATWAAAEPDGYMRREASKGVSIPAFAYPDRLQWHVLSRKVISELREYPATVHATREYMEAFREFGEPIDLCGQVEYECAKAAMAALALARAARRRHGTARWRPGAKDSALECELSDFIADAEEKRKERFPFGQVERNSPYPSSTKSSESCLIGPA